MAAAPGAAGKPALVGQSWPIGASNRRGGTHGSKSASTERPLLADSSATPCGCGGRASLLPRDLANTVPTPNRDAGHLPRRPGDWPLWLFQLDADLPGAPRRGAVIESGIRADGLVCGADRPAAGGDSRRHGPRPARRVDADRDPGAVHGRHRAIHSVAGALDGRAPRHRVQPPH